ncbi:MAG TPA: hypothetical protein VMT35_16965 [Ignavibacteriaceae bacterium]|nr:hypothetical protein [Ignavibacteriaceae bacterium]
MNRKLKNTLALLSLLIFILLTGGAYTFIIQRGKLSEKQDKLKELKANDYNTSQLKQQYQTLQVKASELDSVLASRKFNIPQNLSSIKFYDFVNNITAGFSTTSKIDVEYLEQKPDKDFFYFSYKITGSATYNELYQFIYAIEQSKELKKVTSLSLTNQVATDEKGIPNFLVGFTMEVHVYYSSDDRFSTAQFVENDLSTRTMYDAFYPLLRNEIPPNVDELFDVQGGKLLALIPEGAFLSDSKGNTYLLWEGEPVYLGYLTNIDYDHNKVNFIINKGGIVEKIDLVLEKENIKKK